MIHSFFGLPAAIWQVATDVTALALFAKLVAVSTIIALAIATAIEQKWRR
jgi:uncharacterized membrane protein YhfC